MSFLNRTPFRFNRDTRDSMSSTTIWKRDQPPGEGLEPSGIGLEAEDLGPETRELHTISCQDVYCRSELLLQAKVKVRRIELDCLVDVIDDRPNPYHANHPLFRYHP